MELKKHFITIALCIVLAILCSSATEADEEYRVWNLASGKSEFKAAYVTQSDKAVMFQRQSGGFFLQQKALLSSEDQKFIAGLPRTISPYLKVAVSSSARHIAASSELAFDKKQAIIENRRLSLLEVPQLVAGGAEYIAAKELRKQIQQQPKPEKIVLTDNEIDQLRSKLLVPSSAPVFKKELDFEPGWNYKPQAQLSENGDYLAALIYGTLSTPAMIEVWDLNTAKKIAKVILNDGSPSSAWSLSPQGNYLAYSSHENFVVVYDLRADKRVHVHKAAAFAEESIARVTFNWSESEVYFLTNRGIAYRFPVSGGRGASAYTFFGEGKGRIPGYSQFKVSENGEYISCIATGNNILAIPLPMPTALSGFGTESKSLEYLPTGAWRGQVLNHGIVASDWTERATYLINAVKPFAADDYTNTHKLGSAASRIAGNHFSTDRAERYAWKLGRGPAETPGMDIYDLSYFRSPISVPLPYADGKATFEIGKFWVSAEGKRFVLYTNDKHVQVFKLTDFETPAALKIHRELRRCLMSEEYSLIDKFVAPFFKDSNPIPGSSDLPAALEIVMSLREGMQYYESEADYALRLRKWQQACPESKLARLVVAYDAICRGFAARGNGTADKVTEAGWQDLKKYGQEADDVLRPLFKSDQPPAEAYLFQLRVALMLSWDKDKQLDLMARLIEQAPDYQPFHQQAMLNLLPRWSGELGDCHIYATHLAKKFGGDKGEILYGRLAVELMKYHSPEQFVEETKFDLPRAFNSLLLWSKSSPDDPQAPLYAIFCYDYAAAITDVLTEENKEDFKSCKKSCANLLNSFTWNTSLERQNPQIGRFMSRVSKYLKD